jgi:hypothetical protein
MITSQQDASVSTLDTLFLYLTVPGIELRPIRYECLVQLLCILDVTPRPLFFFFNLKQRFGDLIVSPFSGKNLRRYGLALSIGPN